MACADISAASWWIPWRGRSRIWPWSRPIDIAGVGLCRWTLSSPPTGGVIRLKCTKPQFEVFELAEDTQLLSGEVDHPGYPSENVVALPYYGLRTDAAGFAGTPQHRISPRVKLHDRVPVGEVAVRRGEHVHATDGQIGRVRGLVIDPADHHVTHFLLDEGHLWGQKTVAIPIGAVTHIEDGVRLSLTKDEVRDLPPVDVDERTARA